MHKQHDARSWNGPEHVLIVQFFCTLFYGFLWIFTGFYAFLDFYVFLRVFMLFYGLKKID